MAPAKSSSKKKKQQRRTQIVPHQAPNLWELRTAATTGQLNAVRQYLGQGGFASAFVPFTMDGNVLVVPLLQAIVTNNHSEVVQSVTLLAATGAPVDATYLDQDGQRCSALMWAVSNASCRIVEALLKAGGDPCQRLNGNDGMTPLSLAAYLGDSGKLDLLMAYTPGCCSGPDNVRSGGGLSLLMCAVRGGHVCLVRRLRTLGSSLSAQDMAGHTPLHHAALTRQLGAVQYLLRSSAAVNARDDQGCTPLFIAAAGADCDTSAAATAADAAVLQLLLGAGADPTLTNQCRESVLAVAVQGGSVKILQLLEAAGAELAPAAATELLCVAVSWHRVSAARQLLNRGAAVNSVSQHNGYSVLHRVVTAATATTAAGASADMLRLLISRGADVHARSRNGDTPLYTAVKRGHTALAEVLLAAGADAATVTYTGWTCVSRAVANGHCKMLQLLLQRGAAAVVDQPVPACSCCGVAVTALMLCTEPAVLKLLLAAGADVRYTTEHGNTALHTAAQHGYPPAVVCMLLKAGVSITARNSNWQTAAELAAAVGNERTAALLTRAAQG
jgi:ankyrin repeat protein